MFDPDSQPGGLSGFGSGGLATPALSGRLREVSSWPGKSLGWIWICAAIESYFPVLYSPSVIPKSFICLIQSDRVGSDGLG